MTEWFWMICAPGGCSGDVFGGDVHRYNLIVEFDSDDLVRRTVITTDQDPCIDDQTICLDDGELIVAENENTLLFTLEYNIAKTPCAFLRHDVAYESNGFLDVLLASRGAECHPPLIMRNDLTYAIDAAEPYTGRLTVFGFDGGGRLERSYEGGKLNGIETAWSESGEKLYEATYRDNLLHGPVTFWKPDSATILEFCFENGDVTYRNTDDCD